MKERIRELANLTLGEINNFSMEEAIECAENFNKVKETVTNIWNYFDQLAARNHFRGSTAELISSHASGYALELATEFIQLTTQYFPFLRIKATLIPELYQMQFVAEVYLKYKKHETTLEMYKALVEEHVEYLVAQEDSTLRFY